MKLARLVAAGRGVEGVATILVSLRRSVEILADRVEKFPQPEAAVLTPLLVASVHELNLNVVQIFLDLLLIREVHKASHCRSAATLQH